jgi:hypothetical protein
MLLELLLPMETVRLGIGSHEMQLVGKTLCELSLTAIAVHENSTSSCTGLFMVD